MEQNPYAPPQHTATGFKGIPENWELKALALQQLKGVWRKMVLAVFVHSLIVNIPIYIFADFSPVFSNPFHNPILAIILTLAVLAVTGPFTLGFVGLNLKISRGEEVFVKNIFDGFKRFLPCFLLLFFCFLFLALWSLLLIVPGIIKWFGYSMSFYIMYDNPGMKPLEAIKKSQIMMKGYKGKLFLLYLSFLGWGLLCLLTLGIGYLWLYPYMGVSACNFYEHLKRNQEEAADEYIKRG